MNGKRILGVVAATILSSSLGTLVACNGPADKQETVPTSKAVAAASVSIALLDANGTRIGDAQGVLIAPRLVLTSGHSISGKYKWQVTSADGKQVVTGSRGMTYDWMTYDSNKAHPRRHDVGVIHLDAPIALAAYPRIVSDKAMDGLNASRLGGGNVVSSVLSKVKSSPNNYLTDIRGGEALQTGGAVYDDRGILGIVSGRGLATNKLYVARTDQVNAWLTAKVACAGGSTKTYAAPAEDKAAAACDAGGAPGSSSGSTSGNPGSSSGNPNSSNPNGSDNGGSCEGNNDGVCSGAGCSTGGTNNTNPGGGGDDDDDGSNAGSSGESGNPGNSGSGNGSLGSSGSNSNAGSPGAPGSNGETGPGASSSSSGESGNGSKGGSSSGSNANTSSSGSNGDGSGSGTGNGSGHNGGTGGAGTNAHDDGESCQGASDNPETCPPEADGCSGSECGGGTPDESIDYGNCACSTSHGTDDLVVK